MPSRFGFGGLIAFVIVAIGVYGIAKIAEIVQYFKKLSCDSKGTTEKFRIPLKK